MPIFMRQSIGALGRRDFYENRGGKRFQKKKKEKNENRGVILLSNEDTGRYHFLN